MAKDAASKKRGTRKKPVKSGQSDYNAPLDEKKIAMVWVLLEEGHSQRSVARELKCSQSSVSKVLGSDPVQVASIRARIAEDRAKRLAALEEIGISEAEGWAKEAKKLRAKKVWDEQDAMRIQAIPKTISAMSQMADRAVKTRQLLTGGVTERVGVAQSDDDTPDPERLIEEAIALGPVEVAQLPPAYRAAAEQRMQQRRGMGLVGGGD